MIKKHKNDSTEVTISGLYGEILELIKSILNFKLVN